MKLTWYPKRVLLAVALLVVCALALNLAIDVRRGGEVGVLALVAYLGLDTLLAFNPAQWWRNRRSDT